MPFPYSLLPVPEADEHTDVWTFQVKDMALVHNTLIRGINSIYEKAPLIKDAQVKNFAGYCLAWEEATESHHDGEEVAYFPQLSKVVNMEVNIEQHKTFHDGLFEFKTYMTAVKAGSEKYDGKKLQTILDSFADHLYTHLTEEIATLHPEKLKEGFSEPELLKIGKDHINYLLSKVSIFTNVPYTLSHHDQQTYPDWPPVPGFIRYVAIFVLQQRYRRYWDFSPYTVSGKPQEWKP